MPTARYALQARYIFPVESEPLADGVITIGGARIVAVGRNESGQEPRDLGNVAILPGLVNAHTHLEFSDCQQPLGSAGMSITDWIRQVIQRRRQSEQEPDAAAHRQAASGRGLVESTALGTTAIGEIATPAWVRKPFASHPIVSTVFLELLGMSQERIGQSLQLAHDHLNTGESRAGNWRAGLSPHAPYSAHPELIRRVCQLSAASQVPVAMHLAESHEELELLQSHSGPFLNLLIDLDAWNPSAIPRGIRPLDYLRLLADAHRALVIHGNFLTGEEVQFVAGRSERMSVVYCPRTHAYFQHAAYPLASMLDCGVNVALGTDSRASNPDLSMLAEMRHVAHQHTAVAPEVVLRLGTLSAAKALGLEHDMGSLAAGKLANLAIVPLGDDDTGDPYDLLFDSPHGVTATMYRGQFTVGPS